jgi:hypothetical protein
MRVYKGGGGCGSSCIGAAPLPPGGGGCTGDGTASRGAGCCTVGGEEAGPGSPAAPDAPVGAAAARAEPLGAADEGSCLSVNLSLNL